MWSYLDGRLLNLIPYKEMVSVFFQSLKPRQFTHYTQLHDIGSVMLNLDPHKYVPPRMNKREIF